LHPNYNVNSVYHNYISKVAIVDSFSPEKCKKINSWISKLTSGQMSSVIEPKSINNCHCLGVNITYIKPNWKYKFNKEDTIPQQFKGLRQRNVPLMRIFDKFVNYYEDNINQAVELDYSDGKYAVGFILPKEIVVPNINSKYINNIIDNYKTTIVSTIAIPKFKHQNKFRLKSLLNKSGLSGIFEKLTIYELIDSNSLKLNDIIHNVTVILCEGTSTANNNNEKSGRGGMNAFIADHPFMYYVRQKQSNTILLSGLFL